MRLRRGLTGAAACVLFALSACGAGGEGSGDGDPAGAGQAQQVDLDFTSTTIDAEPFDGASLEGEPAVLWFWAPWCPTCAAQASGVNAAFESYGDQVNIIGVGGLGIEREMEKFIDRTDTGAIPHLVDESGEVWGHFEVTEQSAFVLIDADGSLVFSGYLDNEGLDERIAAMLT
ncbi:redoxin domain-containing protein [Glycomyces sp. L485]|uniref:redoxin domain-containing protein n=1 Tax=Glycomyces sp. L485 TaxID=2909235 RepID=UPI001F4B439E|nr:redoxin domain-containing protein [Glycomyces sp. L485]MCH7230907.1 redoxin domain-containing protein [Glycomyces sp. L485]